MPIPNLGKQEQKGELSGYLLFPTDIIFKPDDDTAPQVILLHTPTTSPATEIIKKP